MNHALPAVMAPIATAATDAAATFMPGYRSSEWAGGGRGSNLRPDDWNDDVPSCSSPRVKMPEKPGFFENQGNHESCCPRETHWMRMVASMMRMRRRQRRSFAASRGGEAHAVIKGRSFVADNNQPICIWPFDAEDKSVFPLFGDLGHLPSR